MFENISEPYQPVPSYACPCCKYLTLHSRADYEVCPVCFWEDDGQEEHDAEVVRGGPNYNLSLRQAQANYARFGATEERFQPNVRPPRDDERIED